MNYVERSSSLPDYINFLMHNSAVISFIIYDQQDILSLIYQVIVCISHN
jgi:hypothetical protein